MVFKKHTHIVLAAILLLSGVISSIAADVTPDVTRISIEDAQLAHTQSDVQFIDVRTARTWWKSGNKIEKATREDPSRVDEWAHKYNKKTTLIFY